MTVFVDASVIVAIILDEPEATMFISLIQASEGRLTDGVAIWEAARAVSRSSGSDLPTALAEVESYRTAMAMTVTSIGAAEAEQAVLAQHNYGKGTAHPARLNMGDCFAYACARTNRARLLYKGDDFSHTDLG